MSTICLRSCTCEVCYLSSLSVLRECITYQYRQHDVYLVWGPAPSQGEGLVQPVYRRCGHDQSACSVVLRVHFNARIREFYINHYVDGIESDGFYCIGRLGYDMLKPEQEAALLSFLGGRDVFVSLSTGYGKTLLSGFTCRLRLSEKYTYIKVSFSFRP